MRENAIATAKAETKVHVIERTTTIQTARNANIENPEPVRDRAVAGLEGEL